MTSTPVSLSKLLAPRSRDATAGTKGADLAVTADRHWEGLPGRRVAVERLAGA